MDSHLTFPFTRVAAASKSLGFGQESFFALAAVNAGVVEARIKVDAAELVLALKNNAGRPAHAALLLHEANEPLPGVAYQASQSIQFCATSER